MSPLKLKILTFGIILTFIISLPVSALISGDVYGSETVGDICSINGEHVIVYPFEDENNVGENSCVGISSMNWEDFLPSAGNWRIIETFQINGYDCTNDEVLLTPLTYNQCLSSSYFINSSSVNMIAGNRPSGMSAIDISTGGVSNHPPRVDIISPRQETTVGKKVEIKYEAIDDDNSLDWGLITNPVSIFYIHNYDILDPVLIAKDLPAVGSYSWDTSGLIDGDIYRIIVKAKDVAGATGEAMSPALYVDSSEPVFIVKTDPAISYGEEVRVFVESSEDLSETPEVIVVQRGSGVATKIKMTSTESIFGQKIKFEGTYQIIRGYDGQAKISISGKDLAGNIGTKIVSGGFLNIGIDPPPKPVIISPFDKGVVASESISIKGTAREDTEVILLVNGKDTYATKPEASGSFIFENIKLDKLFNYGLNILNVVSKDSLGNQSEAAVASVKYNIRPQASFIAPIKDEAVSGVYQIKLKVSDENKDRLKFTYEVSRDNGVSWTAVASDIPQPTYTWNTQTVADGQVILRVIIDDGFSKTLVTSDKFFVRNFIPHISFTDGEITFTNKNSVVITGSATGSEKDGQQLGLTSLEYSSDGKNWTAIRADDGSLDSIKEGFTVNLSGLKEGNNVYFFRAKDFRGEVGQARKVIVLDSKSPNKPVIGSPKDGGVISSVQFDIAGTSEPESVIQISVNGKVSTGKTNSKGFFNVVGVTLTKHGRNDLTIKAIDQAGNESGDVGLSLMYNNPPDVTFLRPKNGRGLNNNDTIRWKIEDSDGDPVSGVTLAYREGNGQFKTLVGNTNTDSFVFNVSNLVQGSNYQLKLSATDGISQTEKVINFSVDNTAPTIKLQPLASTVFNKMFELNVRGAAFDNFSGVEFVEFSINGQDWFKATITRGFLEREALFTIRKKIELEDGEYNLMIRSVDMVGNVSLPINQKISIDTTGPRVGSFTLSRGQIALLPEGEVFKVLKNETLGFSLSLESDTTKAELIYSAGGEEKVKELIKNNGTGLWDIEINFSDNTDFAVTAEDGFLNKIKIQKIGTIEVVAEGRILDDGEPIGEVEITVFALDSGTNSFVKWQSGEYNQENPIISSVDGGYFLILPPGTYQLLVQKPGYQRLRTSELVLDKPRFINFELELKPREGIRGYLENIIESFQ